MTQPPSNRFTSAQKDAIIELWKYGKGCGSKPSLNSNDIIPLVLTWKKIICVKTDFYLCHPYADDIVKINWRPCKVSRTILHKGIRHSIWHGVRFDIPGSFRLLGCYEVVHTRLVLVHSTSHVHCEIGLVSEYCFTSLSAKSWQYRDRKMPEAGTMPYTYFEGLQGFFIVHSTIGSTVHSRPSNSLEHFICTTGMTKIRSDRNLNLVTPGFKPQSIRMSPWGRPWNASNPVITKAEQTSSEWRDDFTTMSGPVFSYKLWYIVDYWLVDIS